MPTPAVRRIRTRAHHPSPLKVTRRSVVARPTKRQRLSLSPSKGKGKAKAIYPDGEDDDEEGEEEGDDDDGDVQMGVVQPFGSDHGSRLLNRGRRAGRKPMGVGGTPRKRNLRTSRVRREGMMLGTSSPRKRKRDEPESEVEMMEDEERNPADEGEKGDDSADYEDYEETVMDSPEAEREEDMEPEPIYIKEDDDYLLHRASDKNLHRLRKAELIRLWKVAGMWEGGDDVEVESDEHEEGEGLKKQELVDGIVNARASTSTDTSPPKTHSRPNTARRISKLPFLSRQTSHATSASTTHSSSRPSSPSSASDHEREQDLPGPSRLNGRPTLRSRVTETNGTASLPKTRNTSGMGLGHTPNGKQAVGKRSYSLGGGLGGPGRKARFGDDVRSPAVGLGLASRARVRRTSTTSSAPSSAAQTRESSTARPRGNGKGKRPLNTRRRTVSFIEANEGGMEVDANADGNEGSGESGGEESPTVGRRTRSYQASHEADADGDNEDEDGDEEEEYYVLGGQGRGGRRVSQGRHTPARKAKKKAIKALSGEWVDDGDVEMGDMGAEEGTEMGDENEDEESADDPTPKIHRPMTRARRSSLINSGGATESPTGRRTRARHPVHHSPSTDNESEEEPTDSSIEDMDVEEDDQESPTRARGVNGHGLPMRRTRSQVRHPSLEVQLQDMELTEESDREEDEAETETGGDVGDVEMGDDATTSSEVEESEVAEEDEDEEGDGVDEHDHDLAEATQTSLTKLKKAELIQMCENRELAAEGNKKDLIQSLIDWRDANQSVGPSSNSTARPPSGRLSAEVEAAAGDVNPVPVLLREHVHASDPETPPHSGGEPPGPGEPDVVLDLEELGLVDKEIPASQIQKGEKVGSGGYKDVYMGKLRGRAKVAVCEFRGELSDNDILELKLLAELNHPNIVRLLGVTIPDKAAGTPCMVITELCENGDLFDYIRNVPSPTFTKVLKLMINIAEGLEYLHDRKPRVIHRDCKSSNILITKRGIAKVGDFGLARVKSTARSVIRSLVGTVNWQAPELWHPKPRYDYKVDVFSCGMVYWEMLSGWSGDKKLYPWEGRNEHWIYDAVGHKKQRPPVSSLRKHWGNDIVDLVERMWAPDPAERPTMTDVIDDLKAILDNHKKGVEI